MEPSDPDPDPDLSSLVERLIQTSEAIYERTIRNPANWVRVEEGSSLHRALDPSAVDRLGDLVRSEFSRNS